eukprot:101632-Alexandrium_andersonii.AAC.1
MTSCWASPTQRRVTQPWRSGDRRAAGVMPPGASRRGAAGTCAASASVRWRWLGPAQRRPDFVSGPQP